MTIKNKRRPVISVAILLQLSIFFGLLAGSCNRSGKTATALSAEPLRYATNITCERGEGYSVWTLRNPWDTTQVLHRYVLAADTAQTDFSLFTFNYSLVKVPVRSAGVATAVHCGLLDELGVASAISGVCEKQYIDLPAVTEGLAAGRITDFGNGMNPNIEAIMDVTPDVLLLTPFEHSGGYGRVERLGIPIIECAEYMETSPLARAEWIRFYAELFGAQEKADSIFHAVEQNYLELKALAATASKRPRLLTEMLYGAQWFVPCGESTMGMMYADAGADYIFRSLRGQGSTALTFERVLDEAEDADIWLLRYNNAQPLTYAQLASDYQPYTHFRPFTDRNIWACDLAHNHFYEETPFHPDRLLRDLVAILHPELIPDHQALYYRPLAE
ncbi:MAG: ABC transporter substrate-binding protein [Bacteroidaceae bacterium]|nr:ABC transporter substrate-binding protein [Bacteroidaceae bacterium]